MKPGLGDLEAASRASRAVLNGAGLAPLLSPSQGWVSPASDWTAVRLRRPDAMGPFEDCGAGAFDTEVGR